MSKVHMDIAHDVQKEAAAMNSMTRLIRRLRMVLLGLLGAGLLAAIFAAYLRPGFMLDLGNRLFMCF